MKKVVYTLSLMLLSLQLISAQSDPKAEQILTDLLANAKTSAIKTNFRLTVKDKSNNQTSTGNFILKGNKFVLEMDEMNVRFDGKTQWTYVHSNNEVSITEPTEKELSETNPMAILSAFKAKCIIRFAKKGSALNYCIEMVPKVSNKTVARIDVQVNKTSKNLISINVINKNGGTSFLSLTNFQKGVTVAESIFVFDATKHKGVVINDLR